MAVEGLHAQQRGHCQAHAQQHYEAEEEGSQSHWLAWDEHPNNTEDGGDDDQGQPQVRAAAGEEHSMHGICTKSRDGNDAQAVCLQQLGIAFLAGGHSHAAVVDDTAQHADDAAYVHQDELAIEGTIRIHLADEESSKDNEAKAMCKDVERLIVPLEDAQHGLLPCLLRPVASQHKAVELQVLWDFLVVPKPSVMVVVMRCACPALHFCMLCAFTGVSLVLLRACWWQS